jgi:signal transduction histidine kinase
MRAVEIIWSGQPALLASLRDISARRAQEERRRQAQKLEAIGRLTAGVVHDLNNFVTVIDSGLRLLQRRIGEAPADPKTATLIEELFQGTARGAALIQQLLAFSRRQSLAPQPVDLNALTESLTAFLERMLGKNIAIRLRLDPRAGQVFIDPAQLEVAILNLAVNAKDAMAGSGELRIGTSRHAPERSFPPAPDGAFACLTIGDTGCGMSQEVLAQVFEPFFTTKAEGQGTGLGLSQVYGFITQSGGHIRIDSEEGKGTNVHLLLPRAEAAGPGTPCAAGKD